MAVLASLPLRKRPDSYFQTLRELIHHSKSGRDLYVVQVGDGNPWQIRKLHLEEVYHAQQRVLYSLYSLDDLFVKHTEQSVQELLDGRVFPRLSDATAELQYLQEWTLSESELTRYEWVTIALAVVGICAFTLFLVYYFVFVL
jgi:hypothetical protein